MIELTGGQIYLMEKITMFAFPQKILLPGVVLLCVLCLAGCKPKERDDLTGKGTGDWYLQGKVILHGDVVDFQPGKKFKIQTRLISESSVPVLNKVRMAGNYSINMEEYPHEIDMNINRLYFGWLPVKIPEISTLGIFKMQKKESEVTLYLNPGIRNERRPMPVTLDTERGPVFVATRSLAKSQEDESGWLNRAVDLLFP
ncbi:MAG TPA: hypothetical protein PLY90_05970 [Candidatus Hydrogenedentes bacterium]|nr:hypothetical protein [Candidatus Hydrogenedentota bacterium]HOD94873.1 hypothetical protein [Candidatus Hydrogenedentota bacterium]HOM47384.1 hypothetical protein [Candidatus Hydrogenedentota bacterium]HOR50317.1 hypothetical protein [Candidatus Hydrogenedentota bacterium]HPK25524.1 hypothetical protein [Candidatus Hydrogenedentota bacterium]